jgi:hypothetical protein
MRKLESWALVMSQTLTETLFRDSVFARLGYEVVALMCVRQNNAVCVIARHACARLLLEIEQSFMQNRLTNMVEV